MEKIDLKNICLEYLPRYKAERIDISLEKLVSLALISSKKAENTYAELKEPRACSKNIYTINWVKEKLQRDLAIRTLKPISLDNPPPLFRKAAKYFLEFPMELHLPVATKLFDAKPEDRIKVWGKLNLPYANIENMFIGMTAERTLFAKNKGFSRYVDMHLDKCKIPPKDYQRFIENTEIILDYCNKHLPKVNNLPEWFYSEFNTPCYLCRLSTFPFKTLDEVMSYVGGKYMVLAKFKSKIRIKIGESSSMQYKLKTDCFEITIGKKGNTRHRIFDLIHELSHVVDYLENFQREVNLIDKGRYLREKETLKIEIEILKSLDERLYQSTFCDALVLFRRLLFEIELYRNPKQDLAKLYADTFNRCFRGAKQKRNHIYFLDERISLNPLQTLPHAIAHSEFILEMMKKES